jgi:hypothetical protein
MIQVDRRQGIPRVAPIGHYPQAEFAQAIDRALALCPDGRAAGLIMDFTEARGVERHSVVRVRETTRHLISRRDCYACLIAVIARSEGLVEILEVGGAVSSLNGITYRYCADIEDALEWLASVERLDVTRHSFNPGT